MNKDKRENKVDNTILIADYLMRAYGYECDDSSKRFEDFPENIKECWITRAESLIEFLCTLK